MIKVCTILITVFLLASCQNTNKEAEARHAEMKQILSTLDNNTSNQQKALTEQVTNQQKIIEELRKTLTQVNQTVGSHDKQLSNLDNAQNNDAVAAALSLKNIPNLTIKRSVLNILGEIKGSAAEQGVLSIIENEKDSSTVSSALSILKKMGSKSLKSTCISIVESGNPSTMQYALKYLIDTANAEDMKKIIAAAKNIPTSDDYDVRYSWAAMFKLFIAKGNKDCVPVSLSAISNFNKSSFNNICWAAFTISKFGSNKDIAKAIKLLQPYINNNNTRLDSDISYWLRDNAKTKFFPIMKVIEKKASSSYRRYFFQGYCSMVHPIAANTLMKEYETTKDSSTKSMIEEAFKNGYPGIMWFEKEKKAKLIPEAELKALIEKFNKE